MFVKKHLFSERTGDNQVKHPYYMKTNDSIINEAKTKIRFLTEQALEDDVINKAEFEAMNDSKKGPGKFYCTFKVHKDHPEGSTPPERPIVSGSGSFSENIGIFIEYHIRELANKHTTFIQDTPDFLRQIEVLNENEILSHDSILVTIDIQALYTNIPLDEALECTKEALLNSGKDEKVTDFIVQLLHILLKFNIFEFNKELFLQLIGVAMGSRPSPSIANIFFSKKD